MENQKLLKNLNSKGRLLALLLTLTAGLLCCSSAWAWTDPSNAIFQVKLYKSKAKSDNRYFISNMGTICTTGYPGGSHAASFDGYNLGDFTSDDTWYIKGEIWANVKGQNYSYGNFRYFIDDVQQPDKAFSAQGNYDGWCDQNWDRYDSNEITLNGNAYSAGSHTIKCFFQKPWDATWLNNSDKGYKATFTTPGVVMSSTEYDFGGVTEGGSKSKNFTATLYGTSNSINSVLSSNTTDFEVSKSGTTVTVTFHPQTPGDKSATITVTPTTGKSATISVTGTGNNTPTVLIGAKEQIEAQDVTLFGYVKYTGCKDINKVGFIISQTESEVTGGTAQVYEGTATADPIEAGTDFSFSSDEFENETYYYRAWMKASDNTIALSDEVRTFEPQGVCNAKSASAILPIFKSGKTTESATFIESSASIDLTVEKESIADVYHWNIVSQPAESNVDFEDQNKRNTNIEVDKVGTYTFTLTAGCTEGTQYTSERTLTLYVCAPAEETQLYLDNHTNNVLCVGEEATATCITKEGYTYALYNPDGESLGSLAGTGGKQTWRHVNGAGVFTMRTSPTSMPECAAVVSSATQSYNEPTLEITADPGLSVISYQPVTLSKKDVTSDTYVDTNPTWVISTGSDKGYLLNEHNRLAYDNRARESVVFKGGAADVATIKVQASAYKTVNVVDPDEKVENYTKQCPTTTEVTLTVSPAVDDCPQP